MQNVVNYTCSVKLSALSYIRYNVKSPGNLEMNITLNGVLEYTTDEGNHATLQKSNMEEQKYNIICPLNHQVEGRSSRDSKPWTVPAVAMTGSHQYTLQDT